MPLGSQGGTGPYPWQKAQAPSTHLDPHPPPGSMCRALEEPCLGLTSHPFLMPLSLKIRGCLALISSTGGMAVQAGCLPPERKAI